MQLVFECYRRSSCLSGTSAYILLSQCVYLIKPVRISHSLKILHSWVCEFRSYNMGTSDLPEMYAQSPQCKSATDVAHV